jgi:hypothetical protein
LSSRTWAAPLAGVAMGALPWMLALAPVAYNEGGLLLYGTLALTWVMTAHFGDPRRPAHFSRAGWVIAGAMAGLACGVKLTAVPMLTGAIILAWAVVALISRIRRAPQAGRLNVSGVVIFLVVAIVISSPWFVRNLVWTHNPVFPEGMETFGKAHFTDVQVQRWREAHSPRFDQKPLPKHLAAAWDQMGTDWRYGWAFLPLVVAAGVIVHDRRTLFLGVAVASQLLVWLAFTHLQGRFFVLAIPAGAILIGLAQQKLWPAIAACVILVVAGVNLKYHTDRFDPFHKNAPVLLGQSNLQIIAESRLKLEPGALPKEQKAILAGDAQAFWYSEIPSSLLRYRTVFDVPPSPNPSDWLTAWTQGEHGLVIVFPGELFRFKKTYHDVPTPPESELLARPEPYLMSK